MAGYEWKARKPKVLGIGKFHCPKFAEISFEYPIFEGGEPKESPFPNASSKIIDSTELWFESPMYVLEVSTLWFEIWRSITRHEVYSI